MAPSGHCAVFSCVSFRGNNQLNGAMFGPSRSFYYFSRFEITFALLFEDEDDLTLIMFKTGLRAVESLPFQS